MAALPQEPAADSTEPRIFIMREAADAAELERKAAAELLERWAKQNHKSSMSAPQALRLAARSIRAGHHRRGIAKAARAGAQK